MARQKAFQMKKSRRHRYLKHLNQHGAVPIRKAKIKGHHRGGKVFSADRVKAELMGVRVNKKDG